MSELQKYSTSKKKLHIAMFPWLAIGHIIPSIHLANELAIRGHKISILIPSKPHLLLSHLNIHPDLIKFHILTVPQVPNLPLNAQTTADVEGLKGESTLAIAFDAMSEQVDTSLFLLKPDIVFFDFADWIPSLPCTSKIGFKTVNYKLVSASCQALTMVPARYIPTDRRVTLEELLERPKGYPSTTIVLKGDEGWSLSYIGMDYGERTFVARIRAANMGCDAIGIRTCTELEGPMCDYLSQEFDKPVFLSGPVLPKSPGRPLEEKWESWLNKFEPKSVVYCAFGSQSILRKNQFQEMVLGFEMTGLPFFVTISKLSGANSIEEALPEGFLERVGDRGVVYGGWVNEQTQFLNHPSVGCFVSHCGFGSMWESLLSDNQIVLVPQMMDQILITRLLVEDLKVAVEVTRGDNVLGDIGWFTKEDLCKAIKIAMDEDSEVGRLIRTNRAKLKETLGSPGYMDGYIDGFIQNLYDLVM